MPTDKSKIGEVVNSCPVNQQTSQEPPKKHKKFRAIIFFDGTGNNRENTEARLRAEEYKKAHETTTPFSANFLKSVKSYNDFGGGDSSYENDFTNVAKLEKYLLLPKNDEKFNDFDAHFKIYISGIGTEDLQDDSLRGQGLGRGPTGVKSKVDKAISNVVEEIVSYISEHADKDDILDKIQLDSIGFSRGAAAARYFVFASLQDPKLMLKKRLQKYFASVGEIKSGFVGLFDTVASIGLNFSNDTEWLNLDAISASEKVLHLVAADEYRKHFPVTNIKSKGSLEIVLPGVHSDVGGGYTDNASEANLEILDIDALSANSETSDRLKNEINWLVNEQGWYLESEIDQPNMWKGIRVNRRNIRNTYSRIPMHIMKNHIKDTVIKFDDVEIDVRDGIPTNEKEHDNLNKLYAIIGTHGSENWRNETELLKHIRHKYFHFSAHCSIIGVNDPRIVNGKRQREIFNG